MFFFLIDPNVLHWINGCKEYRLSISSMNFSACNWSRRNDGVHVEITTYMINELEQVFWNQHVVQWSWNHSHFSRMTLDSSEDLLFHCDSCRTGISSFVRLLFQSYLHKCCLTNVESGKLALMSLFSLQKIQLLRLLHEEYSAQRHAFCGSSVSESCTKSTVS